MPRKNQGNYDLIKEIKSEVIPEIALVGGQTLSWAVGQSQAGPPRPGRFWGFSISLGLASKPTPGTQGLGQNIGGDAIKPPRIPGAVSVGGGSLHEQTPSSLAFPPWEKPSPRPWEWAKLEMTPPEPKPAGGAAQKRPNPTPQSPGWPCVGQGGAKAAFSSRLPTKPQLSLSPAPADLI